MRYFFIDLCLVHRNLVIVAIRATQHRAGYAKQQNHPQSLIATGCGQSTQIRQVLETVGFFRVFTCFSEY